MSLPRVAKRIDLVCKRLGASDTGSLDDWARPAPGAETIVHRWRGDIQPRRTRGGSGDERRADSAGPATSDLIAFAEPTFGFLTGDAIYRADDLEGTRYEVTRVDRLGEGMKLDHYELGVEAVKSGVP